MEHRSMKLRRVRPVLVDCQFCICTIVQQGAIHHRSQGFAASWGQRLGVSPIGGRPGGLCWDVPQLQRGELELLPAGRLPCSAQLWFVVCVLCSTCRKQSTTSDVPLYAVRKEKKKKTLRLSVSI